MLRSVPIEAERACHECSLRLAFAGLLEQEKARQRALNQRGEDVPTGAYGMANSQGVRIPEQGTIRVDGVQIIRRLGNRSHKRPDEIAIVAARGADFGHVLPAWAPAGGW